ncbi:alpha/beta hydrolase [Flavihumibacter profundi]|uniref:alpha/beta hydrolase n=1 Tax=Flavihumibacter profundi TaxID=2716883 RepID=UPI001CC6417C|nr:alpha/beta fold hydrolase [Flavihumibacter profundi]MBZ5858274.1 lysophospholipase [Flavihumibacter profundi]
MKWSRFLKIFLLLYAIVGIALYYLQDRFLFHPEVLLKKDKFDFTLPHKELNIPFDAVSNLNIVQFPADTNTRPGGLSAPKGVVLYFHGNRKNISWYAKYVPSFTRQGYEVWMIDYPGFGKSTGPLTEERLYAYSEQLYKLARSKYGADSIILYGKSMGTGIAAELATKHNIKMLVLETPYYSIRSLVKRYFPIYPIDRIIHYELPTGQYLAKVIAPVVIFQGTDDGVVPYSQAKKLQPLLKPTDRFFTIEGGSHNDLSTYPLYQSKLDSLLQR